MLRPMPQTAKLLNKIKHPLFQDSTHKAVHLVNILHQNMGMSIIDLNHLKNATNRIILVKTIEKNTATLYFSNLFLQK